MRKKVPETGVHGSVGFNLNTRAGSGESETGFAEQGGLRKTED